MDEEQYKIQFKATRDYLIARVSGTRTRASVFSITMEVFEKAVADNLSHVLVDVRKLEGRLTTTDSYALVSNVFKEIRGKGIKKAAILDEEISSTRVAFSELVARNRGYRYRVFMDEGGALAWLHAD